MTHTAHAQILKELTSPSSPENLLAALKKLKHDIVGHNQNKELWLGEGIVVPLVRILDGYRGRSKRKQNGNSGAITSLEHHSDYGAEDRTVLQSIILIGSLAQGGPPFLPALITDRAVPPLVSMLSPSDSHPELVLAVLRSLNTIADSVLLEEPKNDCGDGDALGPLFAEEGLRNVAEILDYDGVEKIRQQQIAFAAGLITKTCRTEARRKLAVQAEILDSLAKRLASFIIAGTLGQYAKEAAKGAQLSAAPPTARLGPILQAVASIIAESKSRAFQFANCSVFHPVLTAWASSRGGNTTVSNNALDSILPPISKESGSSKVGYQTPLGSATAAKHKHSKSLQNIQDQKSHSLTSVSEDENAPLAYWLAHASREETGYLKVATAWLLAILFRHGFGSKRLERIISMQIIPVLVQLLGSDLVRTATEIPYDNSILFQPDRLIVEQAPMVLALLISNNEDLQFAAAEAGSIKKLSQIFKRTYDPLPLSAAGAPWSLDADSDMTSKEYLGSPGLSTTIYHTLKIRESVISALAAVATFKDEYRKLVTDNGVVPFIVQSLSTDPVIENKEISNKAGLEKVSNPAPVILAACEAATALSRSVSALRTSLIDAGIAKPIFKLLNHPDIQVQIAATGAVVNIVLEFSPERNDMIESGVQTVLCRHAHSQNNKLRLNSLWALKHLVLSASNDMKKSCLEQLEPGWLKQTISSDPESYGPRISSGSDLPVTMESSNAAGEPVDLLNSMDEPHLSTQTYEGESDEDEVNMIDSAIKPMTRARGRLRQSTFVDEEAEVAQQARRDEIAVQEQGLDFIRNLITGENAKELIDHVFEELGQEKLFDILANLLRPRAVHTFSRDRRGGVKHVPPHTEIVISVCYILVHLANGEPRHRQLLISHPNLLSLMVPIFNHSASEARTACVWVVINLTWTDDSGDKSNARQRAFELRKLGIEEKLEQLTDDPVLDTRERVKQAKFQMQELLKG